jgi:hypothetical protein
MGTCCFTAQQHASHQNVGIGSHCPLCDISFFQSVYCNGINNNVWFKLDFFSTDLRCNHNDHGFYFFIEP